MPQPLAPQVMQETVSRLSLLTMVKTRWKILTQLCLVYFFLRWSLCSYYV